MQKETGVFHETKFLDQNTDCNDSSGGIQYMRMDFFGSDGGFK